MLLDGCCVRAGSRKTMGWGPTWHGWSSEERTSSVTSVSVMRGSLNMVSFHLMWGPYCNFKELASKGTDPQGQEDKLPLLLFWMPQRIFP